MTKGKRCYYCADECEQTGILVGVSVTGEDMYYCGFCGDDDDGKHSDATSRPVPIAIDRFLPAIPVERSLIKE